ncbi:hypothetical protein ES319_A06G155000v1 [Gossypium barbadense]|uniref:FLZ-type domain-containing protein n=1 Tax=Gossypium barbadense TaxID=3634 RepID=A0A5J5VGZ9_GOSBA|nr:hypothetical protein ES319_A06G155000v1 [Gossypium barbadense]
MIMKARRRFKRVEEGIEGEEGKKKNNPISANFCKSSTVVVGLRILTQIPQGKQSAALVKPPLKITLPTSTNPHRAHELQPNQYSCFLKSCYLCNKNLSLDKEVFMYRGDQGFCSIECRGRQIVLDEMRELELSSKQMIPSYRHCNAVSGRRHTRLLK